MMPIILHPQAVPIVTLETCAGAQKAIKEGKLPQQFTMQEWCIYLCQQQGSQLPPADWTISTKRVARAGVYQNRWKAECSCCAGGSMYVSYRDRTFWCLNCRNACTDYMPIAVVLPPDDVIEAIERALLVRPDPNTRSWMPSETLEHLYEENRRFGLAEHL